MSTTVDKLKTILVKLPAQQLDELQRYITGLLKVARRNKR